VLQQKIKQLQDIGLARNGKIVWQKKLVGCMEVKGITEHL